MGSRPSGSEAGLNASGEVPPGDTVPISGLLSDTPLFAVFRRIQQEGRSGTLSVLRADQVRQLVFENGELYAARSSRDEHRIGATLVRWGYISEKDLAEALASQQKTHQRIDMILVEKGLVSRAIVDSEARRQVEQIIFSTLSWPDGAFHFEENTGHVELDVAASLSQEMIIEGIRRIPESEQFLGLLGDLSGVPVLSTDPMSSGSLRLLRDAVTLISRIDGRSSLRDLLSETSVSGAANAKLLYSLLFAGVIEVRQAPVTGFVEIPDRRQRPPDVPDRRQAPRRVADRAPRRTEDRKPSGYLYDMRAGGAFSGAAETGVLTKPAPPSPASAPAAPEKPFQSPRSLVLELHRQLDWLSHYDLLGVSRKATPAEIDEAYRSRSLLFDPSLKAHPELVDCWRQLTVLAKWLRVAYGVLSKPDSRAAYDRKIDEATPEPGAEK
ncbi:MAG: DUF4388 domain-containing protein [Acidobacteriota bacterium]